MIQLSRGACLFAGWLTASCTDEPDLGPPSADPATIALADSSAWAFTPADADPLRSHRPASAVCAGDAWREEIGGIELDTGRCEYFALSQPAATDVFAGDTLEIAVWWQQLASLEPATGHFAVLAGDDVLWEEFVTIPGAADVRELSFVSDHDVPAGTPLTLHLHNHGANTWHFHHVLVHPQTAGLPRP